jgi:hypothetical protein
MLIHIQTRSQRAIKKPLCSYLAKSIVAAILVSISLGGICRNNLLPCGNINLLATESLVVSRGGLIRKTSIAHACLGHLHIATEYLLRQVSVVD